MNESLAGSGKVRMNDVEEGVFKSKHAGIKLKYVKNE
jgi:hypothetical protein